MDEKALKKHVIYLESRSDNNLSAFSDEAKKRIKQNNKQTAKNLREYYTKTKEYEM